MSRQDRPCQGVTIVLPRFANGRTRSTSVMSAKLRTIGCAGLSAPKRVSAQQTLDIEKSQSETGARISEAASQEYEIVRDRDAAMAR
jgi:hypothetical protein